MNPYKWGCSHPPERVTELLQPSTKRCDESWVHDGQQVRCPGTVTHVCESCTALLCRVHAGPDETKEDPNA